MLSFKSEIEEFLSLEWSNTNNKEQNFQGRLYAYLLQLENSGYVVEMETSRNDNHLCIPNREFEDWVKTEIDILVYKKDLSEKYAAELKWFYSPYFHYFDYIKDYKQDIKFAKQLVKLGGFTEACSIVVVNSERLATPSKLRRNYEELMHFAYKGDKSDAVIVVDGLEVPIVWHDLINKVPSGDKCYYYISSFSAK